MLLMIDNYDSFTYNLVQYFGELGQEVRVRRNDDISLAEITALQENGELDYLVVSPGPCDPDRAGISMAVIEHFAGKVPILGVCLGHQAIGQVFGGRVIRAGQVMHGRISSVYHNDVGVFSGIHNPFNVTRYHSLVLAHDLPDCLELTAWTQHDDGSMEEIMGVRHKTLAVEGVQFHPESILSEAGHHLLQNFLRQNAPS